MKNVLYSLLLFASVSCVIISCSNGDYIANPSSNANGSINPLKPLKASEFTWTGTDPISLNINGSPWVATDSFQWHLDTTGTNVIYGRNGKDIIFIYLKNTYGNNLYFMGFNEYDRIAQWINLDSIYVSSSYYQSSLGNSGEVFIIENDSAIIKGKFYFQGANARGQIVNITNGYFNLHK